MKTAYLTFISACMLVVVTFLNVSAQFSSGDKENARLFVQKFYDQYNKLYNDDNFARKHKECLMDYTFKNNAVIFDKRVIDEYKVYDKAMPKQADEIVGLDFDPIMAAQDNGFDYYVGDIKQKGQTILAEIHCGQKGKGKISTLKEPICVVAEVEKENGQWKFVNFYYPLREGNGTNLIGLFKNSEKEAKEYMASHKSKTKS